MNTHTPNQDSRISLLVEECNFEPVAAKIFVEYNGKCVYCGIDLFESGLEYYSAVIDRILPKAKYPKATGHSKRVVRRLRNPL
ncbi:MAG TPA: hypothetical protein VHY08_14510 [Bacillota bacterium]|nr:hypothetical protein [Bacillota bacterium]